MICFLSSNSLIFLSIHQLILSRRPLGRSMLRLCYQKCPQSSPSLAAHLIMPGIRRMLGSLHIRTAIRLQRAYWHSCPIMISEKEWLEMLFHAPQRIMIFSHKSGPWKSFMSQHLSPALQVKQDLSVYPGLWLAHSSWRYVMLTTARLMLFAHH